MFSSSCRLFIYSSFKKVITEKYRPANIFFVIAHPEIEIKTRGRKKFSVTVSSLLKSRSYTLLANDTVDEGIQIFQVICQPQRKHASVFEIISGDLSVSS